jgi:hypothetical protein
MIQDYERGGRPRTHPGFSCKRYEIRQLLEHNLSVYALIQLRNSLEVLWVLDVKIIISIKVPLSLPRTLSSGI